MTHVLHIDTSPRLDRSHSRSLAREFLEQWKRHHPEGTITHRDLAQMPKPPSKCSPPPGKLLFPFG